jgi:hypothetical protein
MDQSIEQLHVEMRYAQRLCQRTARLYRRVQTCSTFLSILAGSGALITLSTQMPHAATIGFALMFAAFGAINIAVRPADKVAQNEADVRKYAALLTKTQQSTPEEAKQLIAEARQSDTQEVEPLRNLAFNDVMREINRDDQIIPLTLSQRMLGALA